MVGVSDEDIETPIEGQNPVDEYGEVRLRPPGKGVEGEPSSARQGPRQRPEEVVFCHAEGRVHDDGASPLADDPPEGRWRIREGGTLCHLVEGPERDFPRRFGRRLRHLVDEGPGDGSGAEPVGTPMPLQFFELGHDPLRDAIARDALTPGVDGDEAVGDLGLRIDLSASPGQPVRPRAAFVGDPEEERQVPGPDAVEEGRPPPQGRRGEAESSEGVAEVEVEVAKGPLPILPGLPPWDGGEAPEDRPRRKGGGHISPGRLGKPPPHLEGVLPGGVVGDGGAVEEAGNRPRYQIALRRVEVPAGGVRPQRPGRPASAGSPPGRDGEGVEEELGDRLEG